MKFTKKILVEALNKKSTGNKTFTNGKKQNVIISEEQLERVLSIIQEQWQEIKLEEDAKPDFLDLDGDGDKKETMKKAAKDKKEMEEGKKKDHDGDGDIDSDDYLAAKDKAIKKAMKKDVKEDSEGEETYNYGEDEGHDKKEEMSMEDHIDAIEDHLDHLKGDMGYDEDHEDRREKGTHFESEDEKEKLIQEDIKRMKQIIKPIAKI